MSLAHVGRACPRVARLTISENEIKFQVVMLVVEAVAFLGLAVWCFSRTREGRWALMGAVGAALVGLGRLFASMSVEGRFFETNHIADPPFVSDAHVDTAAYVARAAGALSWRRRST